MTDQRRPEGSGTIRILLLFPGLRRFPLKKLRLVTLGVIVDSSQVAVAEMDGQKPVRKPKPAPARRRAAIKNRLIGLNFYYYSINCVACSRRGSAYVVQYLWMY